MPQIDTSKTLIHEVCPAFVSNVECRPGKYRRFDGLCTNLQHPTWGASLSPFARYISSLSISILLTARYNLSFHLTLLSPSTHIERSRYFRRTVVKCSIIACQSIPPFSGFLKKKLSSENYYNVTVSTW